jgi:hypothetical protein
MQDKDRGWDLPNSPQKAHRDPQSFNRRPENQDRLSRIEPTRVILKQSALDAEPRSLYPDHTQQGPDDSTRHAQGQNERKSDWQQTWPLKDRGNNRGKAPE